MTKLSALALLATLLSSPFAQAYKDGVFRCKNSNDQLPPALYKITSVDVPLAGGHVPYVEVTTYIRADDSLPNSAVIESHVKGFATLATASDGFEMLSLASLRIEIKNDAPAHCTSP